MATTMGLALLLAATGVDGLLAGASLDQSIKQLPARHAIGPRAYSTYSRAADLGPGTACYAALGVGGAALTGAAAVVARRERAAPRCVRPLRLAAALAVLHSLVTARAAPILIGQRRVADDPAALTIVFERFAWWQARRAGLQLATFSAMVWALARYGSRG